MERKNGRNAHCKYSIRGSNGTYPLQLLMMLLLCFWPPVRVMCLNHDVVVLQPWSETALDLGSVANYTSYSNPPLLPVSTSFLDIFIYPFYPNAPPSVLLFVVSLLSCTCSPTTLPARRAVHLDVDRSVHPPASAACI